MVSATAAQLTGRTAMIAMADLPGHNTISIVAAGMTIAGAHRSSLGGIIIDRTTAIHNSPGEMIAVETFAVAHRNSPGAANIVATSDRVTAASVSDNEARTT